MEQKALIPEDYPDYKKYFKEQPYHLCTYALSSIIAWQNSDYQPMAGIWKDALIIAADFRNTRDKRHLILPIAPPEDFPPEQLARIADDLDYGEYWFVPECYLDLHGLDKVGVYFDVEGAPGYDDYIYLTSDLADLKGNKYSKKRNLINQFEHTYIETNRVEMGPVTPINLEECLEFLEKWCEERDCDANPEEDLACEKLAAINTLRNTELLEVNTLMLRIDGIVCAFGVSSFLTSQMATLQYEKAFARIKGLYQYFDNQCAKRLFNGYAYINKESDMGSEGLAKTKKSYHPIQVVKSFRLIRK
jgi:hypothetical protein